MRPFLIAFCLAVSAFTITAQTRPQTPSQTAPKAQSAAPQVPQVVKDLPVRKVVLYKNGVGYFEHAGSVTGNQRVAIDFTSSQLNDVLQSLTVLDEGGGRIAGVNYNSTTPLAEQLKSLSLGMSDDPTSTELFGALRGQRVEVTGGPGGTITGRLMSIETRTEKTGRRPTTPSRRQVLPHRRRRLRRGPRHRTHSRPSASARSMPACRTSSTAISNCSRPPTPPACAISPSTPSARASANSSVSYISEVPVWKSTYRIVFPQTANGNATMQGWAVVDNTVGADWDNVQLSLVAGAPQSFIQPLSQPLYTRRPEIPIATERRNHAANPRSRGR